ncbi:MFS general substrate transporter, partial [Atractiella rhizophila]
IVYFSLLFAILLVALDQTILAPALPVIVSKFNALDKIGWVSSAYFLMQCGLMLFFGTVLNVCDRKWIFITSVIIFEVGSLLCAVSGSVELLIFGRAVAGVGASAIYVSIISILTEITTLEQRPVFFGT